MDWDESLAGQAHSKAKRSSSAELWMSAATEVEIHVDT